MFLVEAPSMFPRYGRDLSFDHDAAVRQPSLCRLFSNIMSCIITANQEEEKQ